MYCRTCGSKLNDNAELCVKCGVRPLMAAKLRKMAKSPQGFKIVSVKLE